MTLIINHLAFRRDGEHWVELDRFCLVIVEDYEVRFIQRSLSTAFSLFFAACSVTHYIIVARDLTPSTTLVSFSPTNTNVRVQKTENITALRLGRLYDENVMKFTNKGIFTFTQFRTMILSTKSRWSERKVCSV